MINFSFKRIFFIAIFFLFHFKISFSQNFKAGVLAGFTASQVSGDELSGFNKSGFQFGGEVSTPVSQKFELSFQMYFIQKGSKKPSALDKGDYTYYKMSLNYIEVPLLFRYVFSKKIQFEAGPAVGILLSSKEEDEFGEIPAPKEFNKFDLSVMLGMNYMLFNNFYLNLEGSNSIIPIRDAGEVNGDPVNIDQYNSVLMFSFKYIFNKKPETQQ